MSEHVRLRIDVGLDLLDRQIVDCDGALVGKVDDVEISELDPGEPPQVLALLLGPIAYGRRIGGPIGRWIASSGERWAHTDTPIRIPMELVGELGTTIHLTVPVKALDRPLRGERWWLDNFIGRIPGASRANQ